MTMSVGLGRIINDPNASILVRKALGALSTPGLIVTDTGITINGSGKLEVKLDPDGGLSQSEDGLAIAVSVSDTVITGAGIGTPITAFVGVNVRLATPELVELTDAWGSYTADATLGNGGSVQRQYGYFCDDLMSGTILNAGFAGNVAAGTGRWNVYMTGTAANHFKGSVAIGDTLTPAKLSVLDTAEQLRLQYNATNYCKTTVASNGDTTIQPVGTSPKINLAANVQINGQATIKRCITLVVALVLDATVADAVNDYYYPMSGVMTSDSVIVSPKFVPPDDFSSWSGTVQVANWIMIRIRNKATVSGTTVGWSFRVTVLGF
jgi:hypothetical protein